jgi:hypothetical protein
MAPLSTAGRRLPFSAIMAVLFGLLFASPAAAHAGKPGTARTSHHGRCLDSVVVWITGTTFGIF